MSHFYAILCAKKRVLSYLFITNLSNICIPAESFVGAWFQLFQWLHRLPCGSKTHEFAMPHGQSNNIILTLSIIFISILICFKFYCINCCIGKQSMPKKNSNSTCFTKFLLVLQSQILIYFCEQSEQFFFKKYQLNYQLSNSSPKMSNSTCFTKLNPNIFLCQQAKRAKKFQIVVV